MRDYLLRLPPELSAFSSWSAQRLVFTLLVRWCRTGTPGLLRQCGSSLRVLSMEWMTLSAQYWAAAAGRYCVLVERGLCAAATFHHHSRDTKQPSDQSLRAFSWINVG